MKYLLDTDHISVWQQQSGSPFISLSARIAQHSPDDFALSVVSFHEQVLGCHTYIGRARSSADAVRGYLMLGRLLSDYMMAEVLPFDSGAAARFDALTASRLRVGTMDLKIAAIALAHGLTVLTRNTRDFQQVPGLLVEDWTT